MQLATGYELSGQVDQAIAAYEEVLAKNPQADLAANNLALLLATRKGDDQDLHRALELVQHFAQSNVPEFLDTLGWVHYLRGDYAAARPFLERAVQGREGLAALQYHLGMVYAKLGMPEQARNHLSIALASDNFAEQEAARAALAGLERPG